MIEVEGNISNQPKHVILIDSRVSHSYISLSFVERFTLKRVRMINHGWFSLPLAKKGKSMD